MCRSAAQVKSVFEAMAEGLVLQSASGQIIDANPAAEAILGLSRDQLLGKTAMDPDWQATHENGEPFPGPEHTAMMALKTGGPCRDQIMRVRDAQTGPRWIRIHAQPILVSGQCQPSAVVTTFVDITDLRESNHRIRELAQRLAAVREEESRWAARVLHEGIAQDMFAIQLGLEPLKSRSADPNGLIRACDDLATAMARCISDTRDIADALHPPVLANMPMSEVLTVLARQFGKRSGLDIRVSQSGFFPAVDESTGLMLFRAAQEALTNVARHAHASKVGIVLRADAEYLQMDVTDDGIGIERAALSRPGAIGLLAVSERVAVARGRVSIDQVLGAGARFSVRLPVPVPSPPRPAVGGANEG